MKLYFAKYLPVEGEIKDGDIIFYNNRLAIATQISYVLRFVGENENTALDTEEQIQSRRKAKLFLCSRDIQVGDKFRHTEILDKEYNADVVTEKDVESYKDDCWIPKQYCFKVLGEISPEAIWVKEGDEFDNYNLINSYGEVFDKGLYNSYKDKDKNYKVALECPTCNHFH